MSDGDHFGAGREYKLLMAKKYPSGINREMHDEMHAALEELRTEVKQWKHTAAQLERALDKARSEIEQLNAEHDSLAASWRLQQKDIELLRRALNQAWGMVHKAEDNVAVLQKSGRLNDARYESHRLQGLRDAVGCFPGEEGKPEPKPCLHTAGCRGIMNCSCANCTDWQRYQKELGRKGDSENNYKWGVNRAGSDREEP